MELFSEVTLRLGEGFLYTLLLFALTLIVALPLGLVISFGSMSRFRPLSLLTRGVVWIVRGTPLMLQIVVFTFGPGLWLNFPIRTMQERFLMVTLAFILNYACYFSEIYRGGIQSISQGQYEAGAVLGMTRREVFFRVILLQVIKRILAPISNEIITLVKDTSLASTAISIEIIYVAKQLVNDYVILWPLFYAGLFYLIFNGLVSLALGKLEKRLAYFNA